MVLIDEEHNETYVEVLCEDCGEPSTMSPCDRCAGVLTLDGCPIDSVERCEVCGVISSAVYFEEIDGIMVCQGGCEGHVGQVVSTLVEAWYTGCEVVDE